MKMPRNRTYRIQFFCTHHFNHLQDGVCNAIRCARIEQNQFFLNFEFVLNASVQYIFFEAAHWTLIIYWLQHFFLNLFFFCWFSFAFGESVVIYEKMCIVVSMRSFRFFNKSKQMNKNIFSVNKEPLQLQAA